MNSIERQYTRECATCGTAIAPLQPEWTVGAMPPRRWVDRHGNTEATDRFHHAHSPTPLCGCGHPAEQAIGSRPARCGAERCACDQHPALDWTPAPGRAPIDWVQIGRDARANGDDRAPVLNRKVRDALIGVPSGDPATIDLMRRYTEGWDSEHLTRTNGLCRWCSQHYRNPTTPACNCAGSPPLGDDGQRLGPADLDERAYQILVAALRFAPQDPTDQP
ncbi:hypothetical protein [Nocardia nova]|uniref:hypothetical protein n=1 Tax=Nocardia nova TaxID=37330 RepID=UPI0033C8E338